MPTRGSATASRGSTWWVLCGGDGYPMGALCGGMVCFLRQYQECGC